MESGSPDAAVGLFGCVFFLIFGVVALACFGIWLWMLIDAIKYTPSADNQRLIWILVIVLTGIVGALIYMFVQRPKNRATMAAGPPPEA